MAKPQKTTQGGPAQGGHFCMPQSQVNELVNGIIQILRKNFDAMLQDLKTGQTRTPPKSIFSKIKNFLWGYENPNNPWYLANRLGGLGYKSSNEVTLHEYQLFSNWINDYNQMKMKLKEEQLVLDDMVKPFLRRLEDEIRDYLRDFIQTHYVYQPSQTQAEIPANKGRRVAASGTSAADSAEKVSPPGRKAQDVTKVVSGDPKTISPSGSKGKRGPTGPTSPTSPTSPSKSYLPTFDLPEEQNGHRTLEGDIKKEFAGTTLYERTLVCLEKLRNLN